MFQIVISIILLVKLMVYYLSHMPHLTRHCPHKQKLNINAMLIC
jgi:hypothetical protein